MAIVEIKIDAIESFADGQAFGNAGSYLRDGSLIPIARTRSERDTAGDPRPSLEERYGSRDIYVARVETAAAALVTDRLLLTAAAYVKAARECDRF